MTSLHKFKLLATQCSVAASSPTRSPSASPVIHLRRRKTLRMLLSRRRDNNNLPPKSPPPQPLPCNQPAAKLKLKDLLLSSPPPMEKAEERVFEKVRNGRDRVVNDRVMRGGGTRGMRPLTATLRQRLLRKSWRPVLVSIPE